MGLYGLQKLTLLDWPGRTACTVFMSGCNFRCPFCHNSALISNGSDSGSAIKETDLWEFLEKRSGILDGVCITGGEPLLYSDLERLLERIKRLGYSIKLDTNGSHPERLRKVFEHGLIDYVAMDIKNSPPLYAKTCGLEYMDILPIRKSVDFLLEGHVDYEFRTTVVRQFHDADSLVEAARFISGAKRYFLQQFIDYDSVLTTGLTAYSKSDMEHFAQLIRPYVESVKLRGV